MYRKARPLVDQVHDTLLDADAWPRALIAIAVRPNRMPELLTGGSRPRLCENAEQRLA
jgi:hypothetical protein